MSDEPLAFQVFFGIFGAAVLSANAIAVVMIRKVNASSASERIGYFDRKTWFRGKYKAIFGRDKLLWAHDLVIAFGLLGLIVALWFRR